MGDNHKRSVEKTKEGKRERGKSACWCQSRGRQTDRQTGFSLLMYKVLEECKTTMATNHKLNRFMTLQGTSGGTNLLVNFVTGAYVLQWANKVQEAFPLSVAHTAQCLIFFFLLIIA